MKLRSTPFPYQIQCVQEMEDFNGRALLALPMGSGKSLTALLYLYNHPEISPVIVVCPASIKWVWESEVRKHLGERVEVLEGRTVKTSPILHKVRIVICNYDILHNWLSFLKALNPQMIIFDESHYLGGRKTLRTSASKELCKGIPKVFALSGTPLINRPAELWPTLNILRPEKWPNFFQFAHKHCNARFKFGHWDFSGASKLKELHEQLSRNVLVRRTEKEIFKDLPPMTRSIIPLDIDNKSDYNKALRDFIEWLKETNPDRVYSACRAEKIVQLGYLLRLAAIGKVSKACDWIDNYLDNEEKLLIFAVHKKVLSALEEKYANICVRVDGSVTGRKRQLAFDRFNKVKKTRLLLGNIDAAGVGWSCTATSDVAIVEMGWSPGKLMQAEKRVYGKNRGLPGRKGRSWLLVAHTTIEEKLCSILQKKQKVISKTLDGGRVRNEMEVYDQLLLEIEKSLI